MSEKTEVKSLSTKDFDPKNDQGQVGHSYG